MKPDAERQRDTRRRMRSAGFVLRSLWVHPLDWPAVKRYVEGKRKGRATPVRYEGRCNRCGHLADFSRPGLHACKWGRCNGEVTAVIAGAQKERK